LNRAVPSFFAKFLLFVFFAKNFWRSSVLVGSIVFVRFFSFIASCHFFFWFQFVPLTHWVPGGCGVPRTNKLGCLCAVRVGFFFSPPPPFEQHPPFSPCTHCVTAPMDHSVPDQLFSPFFFGDGVRWIVAPPRVLMSSEDPPPFPCVGPVHFLVFFFAPRRSQKKTLVFPSLFFQLVYPVPRSGAPWVGHFDPVWIFPPPRFFFVTPPAVFFFFQPPLTARLVTPCNTAPHTPPSLDLSSVLWSRVFGVRFFSLFPHFFLLFGSHVVRFVFWCPPHFITE